MCEKLLKCAKRQWCLKATNVLELRIYETTSSFDCLSLTTQYLHPLTFWPSRCWCCSLEVSRSEACVRDRRSGSYLWLAGELLLSRPRVPAREDGTPRSGQSWTEIQCQGRASQQRGSERLTVLPSSGGSGAAAPGTSSS